MYANAIPVGKPFDKEKFIEGKLKLLKDMCITLTESETNHMNGLKSPREIESFVRYIIKNRWD